MERYFIDDSRKQEDPDIILTSDASGAWGRGGYWGDKWIQLAWEDTQRSPSINITVKELVPIVTAAAVWGREWQGKVLGCRCDNQAVVAVLHSHTSKEPDIMHLLHCSFFFEARFSFHITVSHIAGLENTLADDISRNNISVLQAFRPKALVNKAILPPPLLDMVINVRPEWISPAWRWVLTVVL